MIVVFQNDCSLRERAALLSFVEASGLRPEIGELEGRSVVGLVGDGVEKLRTALSTMPGVAEVRSSTAPYLRAARDVHAEATVIRVGDVRIGGSEVVVIAGPCSVETEEQTCTTARAVARAGARLLRGGAFKPRTSPYGFQGLGESGLAILARAREETGLPVVTEVLAAEDVPLVAGSADVLQVGARNMHNPRLLAAVGAQPKPVLLKRGMAATIDELLFAAEYVLEAGNPRVILCERGIRSFDRATRNVLDVAAIPLLKERTHLPVIADPSHGTGVRSLVPALARAAIAAGADGLIVEVHPRPSEAWSDGPQSLTFDGFAELMQSLEPVARAIGRSMLAPRASARE